MNIITEKYVNDYVNEYGTNNANKIINIIQNSKHTTNFINQCQTINSIPNVTDYNTSVLCNLKFMFASRTKVKFASIILFNIWINEINDKKHLATNIEIDIVFNQILNHST